MQRKKEAKENFEKQLKEERKRLKSEAKESYKKLVVSHRTIPELENLLTEEYEDDEVTVKVTELSTSEIAKQNNWIGPNQPKYESDNDEVEDEDPQSESDTVPGMGLKQTVKKKVVQEEKPSHVSEKEVKRVLKKQAVKNVKKSKVFQQKNKMEQIRQKKKSMVKRKEQMKLQRKRGKHKGKQQKQ